MGAVCTETPSSDILPPFAQGVAEYGEHDEHSATVEEYAALADYFKKYRHRRDVRSLQLSPDALKTPNRFRRAPPLPKAIGGVSHN